MAPSACRVPSGHCQRGDLTHRNSRRVATPRRTPSALAWNLQFPEHRTLASIDSADVNSMRGARARIRRVLRALEFAIEGAHRAGSKIGICGQAPSDYPEIAEFLVKPRIDSLSLSSDVALATRLRVAALEKQLDGRS